MTFMLHFYFVHCLINKVNNKQFVMWKKQMSYKGTKSFIYDTLNTANTEKQCLEVKDNIAYGKIHY